MGMLHGDWLLVIPIWTIGVVLFAGMLAIGWFGSWLRRRHDRAARDHGMEEGEKGDGAGLIVSSVMGLLALLVGFTFSIAVDRYDARRSGVLEEANAIGTTYLRTQLLEEPYRSEISRLLLSYTNNRHVLSQAPPGPRTDAALATNDRLVSELWIATVAAFPSIRGYDFSSSYLETMNAMIDMDAVRKAARRATIPGEVFLLLLIYQLVAAGVVGYSLTGTRGRQSAAFLFFLFGLSMLTVLDLNRPINGWIRVPQQPMIDLMEMMRANPPAAFDRAPAPGPAAN